MNGMLVAVAGEELEDEYSMVVRNLGRGDGAGV